MGRVGVLDELSSTAGKAPDLAEGLALHAEVVSEPWQLQKLAAEWQSLASQGPRPSPFLTWDWISTWLAEFGQSSQLRVLTARTTAGELAGLAPLHLVRRRAAGLFSVRSIEFIGYRGSKVCADHLDFLLLPQYRSAALRCLLRQLDTLPDWDVCVLADLAEDSPVRAHWDAIPGQRRATVPAEICYFLTLPDSVEGLWEGLRQRHRRSAANIGRDRRRLERRFRVRFTTVREREEVVATLAALADLHTSAHARQGESGNFVLPDYRRFHDRLVEQLRQRGSLYLARLDCDDKAAAVLYGFHCGKVLYFYQSGFDACLEADSVGKLLLAWVLEDAVQTLGATEFDFLRGAEGYKTLWAPGFRQTWHLLAWRKRGRGRLAYREWLWRQRLAPWRARVRRVLHPPAGGAA